MEEEALYQKFKARLLTELRSDPALLKLALTAPELAVTVERSVVNVDGASLRGRIAKLIADGFLAESVRVNAVVKELGRTGPSANSGNVGRELAKLVAMGLLTDEADGFRIAPGAKVTKTAVASS